jgi:molybdate transport system substrate-binding protein
MQLLVLLTLLLALPICASQLRAADLNVFAAASLSEALTEIARAYEPVSGDKLRLNFAASSLLARQIEEGASADIFISADEAKMNHLASAGLIATDTRRSFLRNTLVIVVAHENGPVIQNIADLATAPIRRLALAEPQTVPAGVYAKSFLQNADLWEKISRKVVPTENVRACLAAVEAGNVDAAIVYKTDALSSKKVRIAVEIPAAGGPTISYPLAVVKDARNHEAARQFTAYLTSSDAFAVFKKYGFLPAP